MKTSSVAAITTALALCAVGSVAFASAASTGADTDAGRSVLARDRGVDAGMSCGAESPWPPATAAVAARPTRAATRQPVATDLAPAKPSEPGTLALVVAGLALMGFVAGRRQSRDLA